MAALVGRWPAQFAGTNRRHVCRNRRAVALPAARQAGRRTDCYRQPARQGPRIPDNHAASAPETRAHDRRQAHFADRRHHPHWLGGCCNDAARKNTEHPSGTTFMTPQNMSILNLVLQASWVVQLVMLLLLSV